MSCFCQALKVSYQILLVWLMCRHLRGSQELHQLIYHSHIFLSFCPHLSKHVRGYGFPKGCKENTERADCWHGRTSPRLMALGGHIHSAAIPSPTLLLPCHRDHSVGRMLLHWGRVWSYLGSQKRQHMFQYLRTIVQASRNYERTAWVSYDVAFQQQAAI